LRLIDGVGFRLFSSRMIRVDLPQSEPRISGIARGLGLPGASGEHPHRMAFILWLIAVVLVIWGIVTIFRGSLLMGIVLIIVGLLVGPGGVSVFS
jgi:Flp pilus assembly protein TadB